MTDHPYRGARAALLTRHGKESAVAPALAEPLLLAVEVVDDVDTDALGTFTRDVPRAGTQLDAARTKARLACERRPGALGLGSEGSFGPGPFGLGTWDLELLVLLDPARGIEIVGQAYEPGLHQHGAVADEEELAALARRAGFPDHGLVVRPDHADDPRIRKGLRAWEELVAAFRAARAESGAGRVFVENDLRAHQHPTRMGVIGRAARDLAARVACLCPACGAPGFGRVAVIRGLPCAECGLPTEVPVADELGCVACAHRDRRPRGGRPFADPAECGECNP